MAREELLELDLTGKCRNGINRALFSVTSFIPIIMSVVWYKVLVDKVIQARGVTLNA